jgi:hypothetical protein
VHRDRQEIEGDKDHRQQDLEVLSEHRVHKDHHRQVLEVLLGHKGHKDLKDHLHKDQ